MPENLDLAAQVLDHLGPLESVERRIVELVVGQENPPLRAQQHPALGFGRVRGEHRHETDLIQQGLQLTGVDAVGAQGAQGLVEGAPPQRFAASDLFGTLPVLEIFLDDIGQAEIGAEGAHHMVQHIRVESGDEAHQPLAAVGRGFGLAAQFDEAPAQGFHGIEHVAAFAVAQGVAQQSAQQFDAVAQRLVGWGRHEWLSLGLDGEPHVKLTTTGGFVSR